MSDNSLEIARHSASHLLAAAVKKLYLDAQLGIGPAIENGFYYDFLFKAPISDQDLKKIQKEMKKLPKTDLTQSKMSIADAKKFFRNEPYKLELIADLEKNGEKEVSIYTGPGEFVDLCAGPHVANTKDISLDGLKLDKLAGAYWKGDEKNVQMTRIYGLAFESKEQLDEYLQMREEAQKRDHRKLGKELDLFSVSEKVGPGLILWHPKLAKVREAVEDFWRRFHRQRGYHTVYTPHIGRAELWETSGHLENFRENMYSPMDIEGENYFVKPMNCPFHVEIYKSRPRSWREFPMRWNEMGAVYRYEKSGELHGMSRVRGFTQDDAHVLCRKDQLLEEYREVLRFSLDMFAAFGFKKEDVKGYIAVRDPNEDKYIGDDEVWNTAEKVVKQVVEEYGIQNEVEEGGAKFYGPALDLKVKDAIGREWQLTTIQLDMNLPERFKMTYQGKEKEERPIMIHRALLGSLERFFSILIEHYGGAFPAWMAPVQAAILPVAEAHQDYAQEIFDEMLARDLRPEISEPDETLGKRVREAEKQKVPFILVVGEQEQKNKSVTVRERGREEQREMPLADFIAMIQELEPGK